MVITEVAFVGKAPGTYLMLLGGGYHGQRLNKIYRGEWPFVHQHSSRPDEFLRICD